MLDNLRRYSANFFIILGFLLLLPGAFLWNLGERIYPSPDGGIRFSRSNL